MKNFTQYLLESEQKTYDFKIKLANIDVTSDVEDRIEHALEAFEIASISKAKHLPVSDKNYDFPKFDKCDVWLIQASLKYPCTDAQIREVLGTQGRLPLANVVVVPKDQPEELQREKDAGDETKLNKDSKDGKNALLAKDIEEVEGGQVQVGQKRVDSMLKDLAKASTKLEFEKKEKVDSKDTNSLPQNNKSPVAGRKGSK
jgi:hypothetical protein